ncbi:MAG: trimethylamine methyltransferase family protein, partial [Pseudomonadota bacterium]
MPARSGRKARHAQRAAPPAFDPCPPGQKGGRYQPLTEPEMEAIFDTALRLLADLGMGEVPDRLHADFLRMGAEAKGNRVTFAPSLTREAIDAAAKKFTLFGRDPARDIEVGGDRVYFGTGGAAVQTLDMGTGLYRPSTLRDLHDFTRLQDTLANVSWFTRCCIATDVPDNRDLDINTAYALVKNTTKPTATAFTIAAHVAPIVEMFDIAGGGEGSYRARPFLKAHISPVISPMRYGEDAV